MPPKGLPRLETCPIQDVLPVETVRWERGRVGFCRWRMRFMPNLVPAPAPLSGSLASGRMIILVLVFDLVGRFLATVGPQAPFNGPGSKNGAERTQHQPRRPLLGSFRG